MSGAFNKRPRTWLAVALTATLVGWVLWACRISGNDHSGPSSLPHTEVRIEKQHVAPQTASASPLAASAVTRVPSISTAKVSTFLNAEDIWKFALSALASTDPDLVYEGYVAAGECSGLQPSLEELGVMIGGGEVKFSGNVSPERQLAVLALTKRCEGFTRAGTAASRDLKNQLEQRAKYLHSPGISSPEIRSNEQLNAALQSMLLSKSASARDQALPLVMRAFVRDAGAGKANDPYKARGTAFMLAMCDLDKDCSSSSYSTILLCALSGKCDSSLWAGWEEGMSPSQIEEVNKYRSIIVSAVQTGQIDLLRNP